MLKIGFYVFIFVLFSFVSFTFGYPLFFALVRESLSYFGFFFALLFVALLVCKKSGRFTQNAKIMAQKLLKKSFYLLVFVLLLVCFESFVKFFQSESENAILSMIFALYFTMIVDIFITLYLWIKSDE